MKHLYEGKTKSVWELPDGTILLKFKDCATVGEDGRPDPGGNTVGASVDGMGNSNLRLSDYFFRSIAAAGIPTHYISCDLENTSMTVHPAEIFGRGLEVICRYRATGSFMRRYGIYAQEGQALKALVEVTLKDDVRGDPLITRDTLAVLGLLTADEYEILKKLTQKISGIISNELRAKGMELYDIKLEFGRIGGEIALIDELSAGNMRVYKDGVQIAPIQLAQLVLG
ncbi:MAG: phosphoribosylaminoimidazolesuccinocarboxamide synthase [Oscillospiraceae bacterium]|nr:phosphoribosylaminoimidazolesuccinocarboxamide synthase [Oscillospiraceae bacterium]